MVRSWRVAIGCSIVLCLFFTGENALATSGLGPPTLPAGQTCVAYSQALTDSITPVNYSIASGSLPPGLSISNAGLISGTPTTAGSFTFTAQNVGTSATDARSYTVAITNGCSGGSVNTIRSVQTSITTTAAMASGQALTSAMDGGINDAFSEGGSPMSVSQNGVFVSFAAEPKSDIANRTDEAFRALGYANGYNKAPVYKAPPRLDREWNAWADVRGTGVKANDTSGNGTDVKGRQFNVTAGLGRKLTPDMLVGLALGYEHFNYDVTALAGSLKGDGETVGGYFAWRFMPNLRFDAAVGWTNVNYSATAGATTGSFTGSRWLATTGLTGTQKVGAYVIEPSAKFYALWENERAWTDSAGTAQNGRNFSAGRTAVGTSVTRSFAPSNGWTLSPYGGLYADWRFQTDNALPTGTPVASIGTGWSARLTAGLSAKAAGGATLSVGGEYGGIGANYKVWTGQIRGSVPF